MSARVRRASLLMGAVTALLVTSPPDLNAQEDPLPTCETHGFQWGVGPALVSGPGGEQFGLGVDVAGCFTGHTQLAEVDSAGLQDGYPASYTFRLAADGAWTSAEVRLPQTSTIGASAGLSISLSKPDVWAPLDWPIDSLEYWDGGGFNRGWIELGLAAEHESSPAGQEQNVVGGAQLRYGLNQGGWWRLVPSVVLHVDGVLPVASEARDTLSLSNDEYFRWGARAYLNSRLDFLGGGVWQDVRVGADVALYRTSGLDTLLEQQGWADGEYVTVTLSWDSYLQLFGPVGLGSPYARYLHGRWPTSPDRDRGFVFGLKIGGGGS